MYIGDNIYFVMAGQFVFGYDLPILKTTLGSCIAVTAWHPQLKYAAMTHYLLPTPALSKVNRGLGFYGESVLPQLEYKLMSEAPLTEFQISAYGGGSFFKNDSLEQGVGKRNIQILEIWAKSRDIRFFRQDLSGNKSRVITLNPMMGTVNLACH